MSVDFVKTNDKNNQLRKEIERLFSKLEKSERDLEKAKSEARKMWEQNISIQHERSKQKQLLERILINDKKLSKMEDIENRCRILNKENKKLVEQNNKLLEQNKEIKRNMKKLEIENAKLARGELIEGA